jgi:hypothetical protein
MTRHPPQGAAEKSKWLRGNHCKFNHLRRASFRRFPGKQPSGSGEQPVDSSRLRACSSLSPRNRRHGRGVRRRSAPTLCGPHTPWQTSALAAGRSHLPGCGTRPRGVPAHGSDVLVRWRHRVGTRSDRRAIGPGRLQDVRSKTVMWVACPPAKSSHSSVTGTDCARPQGSYWRTA